jgi:hypothetical protein
MKLLLFVLSMTFLLSAIPFAYAQTCPTGSFFNLGSNLCVNCDPGSVSPGGQSRSCTLCEAGKFSFLATACQNCARGRFSASPGSALCDTCPEGLVSLTTGSTSCEKCPPGSEPTSSFSCRPCRSGWISSVNGTCTPCPAGTYASNGTNECINCPIGTFSPYPGSSKCLPCPAGKFVSVTGASACNACPRDTTSSPTADSNSFCGPCPPFHHTPAPGWPECVSDEAEIAPTVLIYSLNIGVVVASSVLVLAILACYKNRVEENTAERLLPSDT